MNAVMILVPVVCCILGLAMVQDVSAPLTLEVWKEQLRKIMAHLPEQEQARVMRKGLHQSVEFYDESNNVADAEAVRDEYEMLILQIK
eukprot:2036623-Amphidinium_carterae.1